MKKLITFLFLLIAIVGNSYAASWVKLRDNSNSKLMLDKQSILEKDLLKRAWLKVDYKIPQKSLQAADISFNQSKLLWYFDCPAQKSATSQVFQYMDDELVYSAAIDAKSAEFIEPVPESDVDIAMRMVCRKESPVTTADKVSKPASQPTTDIAKNKEVIVAQQAPTKPEAESKVTIDTKKIIAKLTAEKSTDTKKTHWSYEGRYGPENWGKLTPGFATCETGRNQSPINIDRAVEATLRPLKLFQRYQATSIANTGNTVQAYFKEGNLLVLDSTPFFMKQVSFHAPSEHQINGKSYPLEAHFLHADAKGNLAIIAVMFNVGAANPALESLWIQLPHEVSAPVSMKSRVLASEFMPSNRSYFQFNGSLTTPPCSEGVRWIVMKNTITASREQIMAFERLMKHHNNRPVQPLNGRLVVESGKI